MATKAWSPSVKRIHQVIDRWADMNPEAIALRDRHCTLSYGQLRIAVRDVAAELTQLGVRGGDRVIFFAENSVSTAVLAMAVSALDAWIVIVNARLSPREIDDFITHSEARLAIYTTHVSTSAAAHAQRHQAIETAFSHIGVVHVGPLNSAAQPEPVFADPYEQVAAMIYTSGTSGTPKAVMLTHANILFAAGILSTVRNVGPSDVIYGVMPMAHVVGLSTQLVGCLINGATLLLKPQFTPEDAIRAFAQDGITLMTGVPAMFAKMLDWARQNGVQIKAPSLRLITVAGSPLSPSLKEQVESVFGQVLHNGYGLTETAPTVALTSLSAPRRDCSVGMPVPEVEVRQVDSAGRDVLRGEVGELWVKGPNVMKGYYKSPDLTALAVNSEGWFNTGDLARQDADGALHIEGRTKEMIIRSGFNVYPVEVEQMINSYPGVVQSAVVGRSVQDNEEVIAFIETGPDILLDTESLRKFLRERLSPYKIPAEIHVLPQLPAAPTGKILKHILKAKARSGIDSSILPDKSR